MQLVRQDYQFKESGLDNVILKDVEVLVCKQCGSVVPRIPRLNDLMRTIVVAIVAKPSELDRAEVRFLRKFMDETIEQFAHKLGVNRSHLSRVENGSLAISKQTKLARLGKTETVLKQLEEIQPLPQRVRIDVASATSEYNYDLEPVAA
jgi:YgiT-type zinc finger domain-containing protein